MPLGPGKYDEECMDVLNKTGALSAMVIVIEGTRGTGFSVKASIGVQRALPGILRAVADQMQEDNQKMGLG